ncbi:MAG: MFS transporter [Burkholderiales bacterium]|nr:MFS transporter [Burkholderiales bacterium]
MTDSPLLPGVKKKEIFAWAMFDFANSGFTTVVITAVYSTYFVGVVAGSAAWATLLWVSSLSASYLISMLLMPVIGAWCDRHASKKRALLISTIACVIATSALGWSGPGDLMWAVFWIIIANVAFSIGESLIAAFLPELAKTDAMGKVSSWGWAWGYVGGMLTLAICLFWIISGLERGLTTTELVPPTMWITATIFLAASSYTFWQLKERAKPQPQSQSNHVLRKSIQDLASALQWAKDRPPFMQLLKCIALYQAGVSVAITVAAIYAEGEMGMGKQETMLLIFLLNIAALFGAWLLGWFQDRIGHIEALRITLIGWVLACVIAATSPNQFYFWFAATFAGLCMGASQSVGRAMVGRLTPLDRTAQVFSLWSVAIRIASIIGPMLYGLITLLSDGHQRIAIASTSLLFIISMWVLSKINWQEAERQAALDRKSL